MDETTSLVPRTAQLQIASVPRSHTALAAGAGVAAVSLASVSLVASYWHNDGRLPAYAAEAVCGTGLCVSLFKLQSVTDSRRRIAHAQTLPGPVPHFNLMLEQQQINAVASAMTGLSAVLGTAAVGIGAIGTALDLPTSNNVAAVSVGLFNLVVAVTHFYRQVHHPAATAPLADADAGLDASSAGATSGHIPASASSPATSPV